MKKNIFKNILCVVLILVTIGVLGFVEYKMKSPEIPYNKFMVMVEKDQVEKILIKSDELRVTDHKGKKYKTKNPKYDNFIKEMLESGIDVQEKERADEKIEIMYGITSFLISGFFVYMMYMIYMRDKTIGDTKKIDGKSANQKNEGKVKFSDVAGLYEVKEDLLTIVDFLKNPKSYQESGAEMPKGVLLYGPPGTGKTLLAKAIAGEAGVNFYAANGSDFEEKYVGVGASRIRKLFEEAKKNSPCIVFIDEIDSLGGKRTSVQGNHDRQTLNTLLSEIDGFNSSSGVIVIGATNRIKDLDEALTRPGRFDNHFAVPLPESAKERLQIINLYLKNKKIADDVDVEAFAKETVGSSPAMLKTVINEAAILATKNNNGIINNEIINEAWLKQLMEGHLKKDGKKENSEIVAWHEAGHALVSLLMEQELTKVSIIPSTSGAGGATFITPKKMGMFTKKELEEQVMMLYAGRNAERILTGSDECITTGAVNDIERATDIIREMIETYGMNEFGLLNLKNMNVNSGIILKEASKLAEKLENKSYELLFVYKDILEKIANGLMENETLSGKEVKEILDGSMIC